MVAITAARRAAAPNAELLSWLRHTVWKKHDRSRVHIVSPKLCGMSSSHSCLSSPDCSLDDVVKRLESTLPPPGTCDLLDLNPGICVWSQKLHSVLQPRKHILVEPERELYAKFLDPLLETKGSVYGHAHSLSDALDPASGLLSSQITKTLYQGQPGNNRDSGTRLADYHVPQFFNRQLLITANLSSASTLSSQFAGSAYSREFLNSYFNSLLRGRAQIHRYGLVRLLAWIPDVEKETVNPRSVAKRSKLSIQYEAGTDLMEWATGPAISYINRRRTSEHELEDQQVVAKRQQINGFDLPKGRETLRQPNSIWTVEPKPENMSEWRKLVAEGDAAGSSEWLERFLILDERIKSESLDVHGKIWSSKRLKAADAKKLTKDQQELALYVGRAKTYYNGYVKTAHLAKQQREIEHEYRDLQQDKVGKVEFEKAIKILDGKRKKVEAAIGRMKEDAVASAKKAVDDYRAYDGQPQALAWNGRLAEPILVNEDEFRPTNPLAFMDFAPTVSLLDSLDTLDKIACFDFLLLKLMSSPSVSITEAMQSVLGAGVPEFLETVPSIEHLKEIHDLDDLRVRSLPAQTLVDIAIAFEAWPFRPSIEQMVLSSGANANDFGSEYK